MTKPRILIATGIYPPEVGGPATYAKLLFDRLPEYGFETAVLPFREARKYTKIIRHIYYFYRVSVEGFKSDIIFTQDPVSTGIPCLIASKLLRKPLVVRVAGDYAWEQSAQRYGINDTIDDFQNKRYGLKVEALRFFQKLTVRYATVVICPSEYFQNLVGRWTPRKEPVKKIYNGIDFSIDFERGEKYPKKTIITAGRLVPWKGIEKVIELLIDLPNHQLIIAGDGPERHRLEEHAKTHNVSSRVHFLGNIDRKALFQELHKSHIFILNTSFESFSFQIVEALFVGIPVIATNIGNLAEIVRSGSEGILVEPNDKQAFLDAIKKIESNSSFRESLVKLGHEKARFFSIESTLGQFAQVLKEAK